MIFLGVCIFLRGLISMLLKPVICPKIYDDLRVCNQALWGRCGSADDHALSSASDPFLTHLNSLCG